MASSRACGCGHAFQAHQHYRRGNDCGVCGRDGCTAFSRVGTARPLLGVFVTLFAAGRVAVAQFTTSAAPSPPQR